MMVVLAKILNSYQKRMKQIIEAAPFKIFPPFCNLPTFTRFSQSTSFFQIFENPPPPSFITFIKVGGGGGRQR